jgi:hypothetical protein
MLRKAAAQGYRGARCRSNSLRIGRYLNSFRIQMDFRWAWPTALMAGLAVAPHGNHSRCDAEGRERFLTDIRHVLPGLSDRAREWHDAPIKKERMILNCRRKLTRLPERDLGDAILSTHGTARRYDYPQQLNWCKNCHRRSIKVGQTGRVESDGWMGRVQSDQWIRATASRRIDRSALIRTVTQSRNVTLW